MHYPWDLWEEKSSILTYKCTSACYIRFGSGFWSRNKKYIFLLKQSYSTPTASKSSVYMCAVVVSILISFDHGSAAMQNKWALAIGIGCRQFNVLMIYCHNNIRDFGLSCILFDQFCRKFVIKFLFINFLSFYIWFFFEMNKSFYTHCFAIICMF